MNLQNQTVHRLIRAVGLAFVCGIATAAGSAVVTGVIWWIQTR